MGELFFLLFLLLHEVLAITESLAKLRHNSLLVGLVELGILLDEEYASARPLCIG